MFPSPSCILTSAPGAVSGALVLVSCAICSILVYPLHVFCPLFEAANVWSVCSTYSVRGATASVLSGAVCTFSGAAGTVSDAPAASGSGHNTPSFSSYSHTCTPVAWLCSTHRHFLTIILPKYGLATLVQKVQANKKPYPLPNNLLIVINIKS